MNIKDILGLIFGGALGTLLRYEMSYVLFERVFKFLTPWPTLLVNVLGSFFIGLLYEICTNFSCCLSLKKFLFIGFLGAFTTFSTYSLEAINLFKIGRYQEAIMYILFSNAGCLLMVLLGMWFAKNIFFIRA